MKKLHCDAPDCDKQAQGDDLDVPPGWKTVSSHTARLGDPLEYHLCSWACVNSLAVYRGYDEHIRRSR